MSQDGDIVLIVRTRNRLEYTIQTLNSLGRQTVRDRIRVFLIDQDSQDGTAEWVRWIRGNEKARAWFPRIHWFPSSENTGDWGGMQRGFEFLAGCVASGLNVGWVGQLDNDIVLTDPTTVEQAALLSEVRDGVVMAKRTGVTRSIEPSGPTFSFVAGQMATVPEPRTAHTLHKHTATPVPFCVAFWVLPYRHITSNALQVKNCREFTRQFPCFKIQTLRAWHVDGDDWQGGYLQYTKYKDLP